MSALHWWCSQCSVSALLLCQDKALQRSVEESRAQHRAGPGSATRTHRTLTADHFTCYHSVAINLIMKPMHPFENTTSNKEFFFPFLHLFCFPVKDSRVHLMKKREFTSSGASIWQWIRAQRHDTAVVRMAAAVLPACHCRLGARMSFITISR